MDYKEPNDELVASNCNDEDSDAKTNPSAANSNKVTYQHLLTCCQELASTVQNDQPGLTKMLPFFNQAIDKYLKDNKVNVLLQDFSMTSSEEPQLRFASSNQIHPNATHTHG
jgi:hypothetical protein